MILFSQRFKILKLLIRIYFTRDIMRTISIYKIIILFINCILSMSCYCYASTDTNTLAAQVNIVDDDLQGFFKIKLIASKLEGINSDLEKQDRFIIRRIGLIDEIQRSGIKKRYLNVFKGIAPSTFYYWKKKYRFDSLTQAELEKFKAEYQNILRDEIEVGFLEIDNLIENIIFCLY